MPYSKAHYYLIALIGITIAAFWPSYFGKLNEAPLAHHLHGLTSTLWILLLASQNWLIHNGHRKQHRAMGKTMFILVPLMTASFALVTWVGAQKTIGGHPFYEQFGEALLSADVMLLLTTSLQVYLALRLRKSVHLHSALMLGTLIGLIPPILSRLMVNWIPSWNITGLDTMYRFGYGLDASIIIAVVLALTLFICYRKHGWPWLLAAGIAGLMYLLYATLGQSSIWSDCVVVLAGISPLVVFSVGLVLGVLSCALGWLHGSNKTKHHTVEATA